MTMPPANHGARARSSSTRPPPGLGATGQPLARTGSHGCIGPDTMRNGVTSAEVQQVSDTGGALYNGEHLAVGRRACAGLGSRATSLAGPSVCPGKDASCSCLA